MSENSLTIDAHSLTNSVDGWVSAATQIVRLTSTDNVGSYLSLIGLLLLGFSVWSAFKLIKSDPTQTSAWHKYLTFFVGAIALLFVVAGPTVSVLYFGVTQARIAKSRGETLASIVTNNLSSKDILERLKENHHVRFLARLIPYDPQTQPELSLERVASALLGPPLQRFTFVADYEEVKGYSAADAVRRTGLSFQEGQRVSAIIFPLLSPRQLIPVNARGLLQIIDLSESNSAKKTEAKPSAGRFDVKDRLGPAAYSNLKDLKREKSWSWAGYKDLYKEFCNISFEFVCSKGEYATASLMGNVTHDWHPMGFARSESLPQDPCDKHQLVDNYCSMQEWPNSSSDLVLSIGARVFMTDNSLISTIPGRILIDFNDPTRQKIPIIYYDEALTR